MTTLHLVRPELRGFVEASPAMAMSGELIAQRRSAASTPASPPTTPGLEFSERRIPGAPGAPDVRVLIYRPTNVSAPVGAILHVHGGGYVIGTPDADDLENRQFATELGCVVVSVDYRLAPETPFPGPADDGYAALVWLHDHAPELGVDPRRIALKGESAGGGLAAGVALMARDRGKVPVAFQCLTAPMIDDRPATDPHPYVGEFVWSRDSNRFGWAAYLGQEPGSAGVSPYAAAARATDLAGLPPALIVTGALDLFLEEDIDYARRLTRAGVAVELQVYPGVYHGFRQAGDTALRRRYHRDCREALAEAFRPLP